MAAQQMIKTTCFRLFTAIISLAMFICGNVLAADAKVNNATVPLLGRLANNSWNIMEVVVNNPTSKPLKSTIIVQIQNSTGVYMRPVWLPANSKGKFPLPVFCSIPESKLKGKSAFKSRSRTLKLPDGSKRELTSGNASVDYTAALLRENNGDQFGLYNGKLLLSTSNTPPVLIMDEYKDAPKIAETLTGWDNLPRVLGDGGGFSSSNINNYEREIIGDYCLPANNGQQLVFFSRMRPESFSRFASAYSNVGSLWIGSLEKDLCPAEKNALDKWLHTGGRFNICPQPWNNSYLQHPFWAAASPANLAGFTKENTSPLQPLTSKYGGKLFTKDIPDAIYAMLLPENPEAEKGLPLIAESNNGLGASSVIATATAQAAAWSNSPEIYTPLMLAPKPLLAGVESNFIASGWQEIQNMTGWAIPGKMTIAAIMLTYLVLGSAVLFFMRKKGNAEYGWVGLMALGVVFFGIYFAMSTISRSSAKANSAETGVSIMSANSSVASNYSFFGIYPSGNMSGTLLCKSEDTLLFPAQQPSQDGNTKSQVYLWGKESSLPTVNLATGNFWATGTKSFMHFGKGIRLSCTFGSKGPAGQVLNNTQYDLEDCFIRFNRICYYVGNLQKGQARDFTSVDQIWQWNIQDKFRYEPKTKKEMLLKALFPADIRYDYDSTPAFCGFITQKQIPFTLAGNDTGDKAVQLVACSVPATAKASEEFIIPQGVCGMELSHSMLSTQLYSGKPDVEVNSNSQMLRAQNSIRGSQPAKPEKAEALEWPHWRQGASAVQMEIGFKLPEYLGKLEITGARIILRAKTKGMKLRLSTKGIGNKRNSDNTIKSFITEDIDSTIELDKKLLADNRLPQLKLYISPSKVGDGGKWEIEIFDIEIRARRGSGGK